MTTKHNCNNGRPPVFGRKTPGCPRCDELLNGAAPIVWVKRSNNIDDLKAHFASDKHRSGKCGPVCTFGEW